jgi:hypothetical protein
LTTFLYDELLGTKDAASASLKLKEAPSYPLLDYVFTRTLVFQRDSAAHWRTADLIRLLEIIAECREEFRSSYRKLKVGFSLIVRVREFMAQLGYKSVESDSILDMMSKGLRGRLSKDWKYLGIMIKYVSTRYGYDKLLTAYAISGRKLSIESLSSLIEQTNWFFEDLPEDLYEQEEEARAAVTCFGDEVLNLRESDELAMRDVANRVGEWFIGYLA